MSILPELLVLVKKRRSLLHNKENEEYARVVEEIVELQRKANEKHLHEALEMIDDYNKPDLEGFKRMYLTCLAN